MSGDDHNNTTETPRTYGIDYGDRVIELTTWDDEPVQYTLAEARRQVWDDGGRLVVRSDSDGRWVPARESNESTPDPEIARLRSSLAHADVREDALRKAGNEWKARAEAAEAELARLRGEASR